LKKALKRHGRVETVVTDGLRSYSAAMRELGNLDRREMGCWLNNRVENSHLTFRRRERAMLRFRRMKSLQNSPQFTPACTTISIRSATSSIVKLTSCDARLHSQVADGRRLTDCAPGPTPSIGDKLRTD